MHIYMPIPIRASTNFCINKKKTHVGMGMCLQMHLPLLKAFHPNFFLFLKDFTYLFLERGKGGRKGEKHQCVVASRVPPTGDLACNPGMSPDWESNQGLSDSWASAQSTEPHQPGLGKLFLIVLLLCAPS